MYARAERLVEALAAHPRFLGYESHASRLGDDSQSSQKYFRVRVFRSSGQVLGDDGFVVEIGCSIKRRVGGSYFLASFNSRAVLRSGQNPRFTFVVTERC